MANDTCPCCGAEKRPECTDEWTCGTTKWGDRVRMSDHCETRQNLAEVTSERDALARRIADAPVGRVAGFHDGCMLDVELGEGEQIVLFNRVRLVRDEESE